MKPFVRVLFNSGLVLIVFGLAYWHADQNGYPVFGTFRFPWLVAFAVFALVLSFGLAVPDVGDPVRGARLSLGAVVGSLIIISAAQLLLGTSLLPRSVLFGAAIGVPLWGAIVSALAGRGQRQRAARDRVVAIVGDAEADRLRYDLGEGLERELTLVETVSPTSDDLDVGELVAAAGATILVLGREAADDDHIVDQASELHAAGLRVWPLLSFYEEWVGKLPVSELQRSSLFFDISDVHRAHYQRASRLLDVLVALVGAPFFLLVLPFVLVGNLIGNRGPLFFRQSRVGRSGTEFDIMKLRSMKPGTSSTEWTAEGDLRITAFGRLLRSSHIDELPQLINILKGDISVVGPRPEQPHYVKELASSIPLYNMRHVVQPGLTGWAQVNYRYGNTTFDAIEKLQFEFYYLRHQSLWLDLKIIARTVQSVVGRKGK